MRRFDTPPKMVLSESMSSNWFPEPIYKKVRAYSLALILILFTLGIWYTTFWFIAAVYLFLWGVLTAYVSYRIESGFFMKSVNQLNNVGNSVFITFDDGPCEQTADILDKLKSKNVRASFFCVGERVRRYPEITRRIVEEGHSIGNHSYFHRLSFPLSGPHVIGREIDDTQKAIEEISGNRPVFFRPPFGVTNPLVASALENKGLICIGWSIRSLDTVGRERNNIKGRIEKNIGPGSIILLHDNVEGAIEILDEVLDVCSKRNLIPVSLESGFTNQGKDTTMEIDT